MYRLVSVVVSVNPVPMDLLLIFEGRMMHTRNSDQGCLRRPKSKSEIRRERHATRAGDPRELSLRVACIINNLSWIRCCQWRRNQLGQRRISTTNHHGVVGQMIQPVRGKGPPEVSLSLFTCICLARGSATNNQLWNQSDSAKT